MNAGAFKKLITIEKYVEGFDNIGNPSRTWVSYKKAYAYVNGLSGSEYWEAANIKQENTVEFIFRWKPFFNNMNTKQYRINFNNFIYDINLIDNIQFKNKTVKIKAVTKNGTED